MSRFSSVLDAITYDPYGNIINQTNAANAPRFLYAGGTYDSLTGNDQFGRRYYDPSDGRWTSQDPLGFKAGDTNLYRYVYNDPAILIDSSGEFGTLPIAVIGAGVGAIIGGISAGFTKGWTWKNVSRGAAIGAVAGGVGGLTLGLAGSGIAAAAGGGWLGSGLAGATAGVAGDVAGQGLAMGMGWQDGFSGTQLVISGGVGFVFGSAGSLISRLLYAWQSAPVNPVTEVGEGVSNWLGQGARILRSDARGFVIQSQDGLRQFRIDFSGPGTPPAHAHFEIRPNTKVPFRDAVPGKHRFPIGG